MARVAVAPNELYDFLSNNPGFGSNTMDHLHYIDWGEETDNVETLFDDPRDRRTVRRLIRNGQFTYHCNSVLDGTLNVKSNPWIKPWPDYDLVLAWQKPYACTTMPLHHYHCQNRLKKPHRTAMVNQLWQQDRFSRGTVSYTQELTAEWKHTVTKPTGEYEWQMYVQGWLPSTEGYDADLVTWENNPPPPLQYWNNAAINIITETKWLQPNLTEKTFSAMLWGRPLLIMGAPGVMKHMRSKGYETHNDVLDIKSFDRVQDIDARATALAKVILEWDSAQELYRATVDAALRNQARVIHSTANLVFPSILTDDSIEWVGSAQRFRNNCYVARHQAQTML